jgi:hypothetical protein
MEGGSRTPDSKTFNTSCKDGCKQNRLVKRTVFAQVALDMMSLALHAVFNTGAQIRDAKTHPTRQKPEMQHVEIPGHLKQAKTSANHSFGHRCTNPWTPQRQVNP